MIHNLPVPGAAALSNSVEIGDQGGLSPLFHAVGAASTCFPINMFLQIEEGCAGETVPFAFKGC